MLRKNINSLLMIFAITVACTLELWLISFGKNSFGVQWSPLVVFVSGLFSGIGFLLFFYQRKLELPQNNWNWKRALLALTIAIIGIWQCGEIFHQQILTEPIDFLHPTGSDIIPQLNVLVTRFLSGVFPYQLITEWPLGHHLYPTYLPLTWLPFIVPEVIGFDYRWMAFSILILSFLFYFQKVIRWNQNMGSLVFSSILPFLFLFAFQKEDNAGVFRFSVEALIAGYYLILSLALFSKSNFLRASALTLCLLSRYAVVLWIPLFLFVIFFKEGKMNFWKMVGWLTLLFLVFYAVPFLSQDASIFMKGYAYHAKAAPQAWNILPWQAEGELPAMLTGGYGMAIYFYQFLEGTWSEKLFIFKITHVALLVSMVSSFIFLFYKIKSKVDDRIFLLGTLKIYLVVFYNFIQMPFNYLFLPLVFISLPMILLLVSQAKVRKQQVL